MLFIIYRNSRSVWNLSPKHFAPATLLADWDDHMYHIRRLFLIFSQLVRTTHTGVNWVKPRDVKKQKRNKKNLDLIIDPLLLLVKSL